VARWAVDQQFHAAAEKAANKLLKRSRGRKWARDPFILSRAQIEYRKRHEILMPPQQMDQYEAG
jgi:hypothetical protein